MTTENTTPRNAQEALQQASRYERAKTLREEGYTFTDMEGDGSSIAVCKPGRLAASYWIVDSECDCPDRLKNKKSCKHELAWEGIRAEAEDEAKMWESICAKWEDENPLDCIPTPTLESIAAKDLYRKMSADLQRVEMAIHTHGARMVNPIQCQQDRSRAAALQCAVHVVAEYR